MVSCRAKDSRSIWEYQQISEFSTEERDKVDAVIVNQATDWKGYSVQWIFIEFAREGKNIWSRYNQMIENKMKMNMAKQMQELSNECSLSSSNNQQNTASAPPQYGYPGPWYPQYPQWQQPSPWSQYQTPPWQQPQFQQPQQYQQPQQEHQLPQQPKPPAMESSQQQPPSQPPAASRSRHPSLCQRPHVQAQLGKMMKKL
ncbi:hypothetical protein XPA_000995 [Xanthoria parietina]